MLAQSRSKKPAAGAAAKPKAAVREQPVQKRYTPRAQKTELKENEFETVVAKKNKFSAASLAAVDSESDDVESEDMRIPNLLLIKIRPQQELIGDYLRQVLAKISAQDRSSIVSGNSLAIEALLGASSSSASGGW